MAHQKSSSPFSKNGAINRLIYYSPLNSIDQFHSLGHPQNPAEGALKPLAEQARVIKEAFAAIKYEAISAAEILLPEGNKGAHVSSLAARNATTNFPSR